jgi:glycine cleavage system H protein
MYPENYRYTKEHEWVLVEGDTGTVGISFHAQKELGDIVFVELPKVGTRIEAGKNFAVVESVKAASEIYSPVTGEVIAANDELTNKPELINTEPYTGGWIAKIKLSSPDDVKALMTRAEYVAYIGEA